MQAQDKWVGFAGIEVDGLQQAVLDALELAGDVERKILGRNVGLGQAFVLRGSGEGYKEEEDRGVDEMTHGGFCLYGGIDITSAITRRLLAITHFKRQDFAARCAPHWPATCESESSLATGECVDKTFKLFVVFK